MSGPTYRVTSEFRDYLKDTATCDTLRKMARVMNVRVRSSMRKRDLVSILFEEFTKKHPGRQAKGMLQLVHTRVSENKAKGYFSRRNENEVVVQAIERNLAIRESAGNARYAKYSCPAGEERPKWGRLGASDCGPGYVQLDKNGCCRELSKMFPSMWDTSKMSASCEGVECSDENISQDLSAFSKKARDETRRTAAMMSKQVWNGQEHVAWAMRLMAIMQDRIIKELTPTFDDALEESEEGGETCDFESGDSDDIEADAARIGIAMSAITALVSGSARLVGKVAAIAGRSLAYVIRAIWYVMRKLFGYVWSTTKHGLGMILSTTRAAGRGIYTVGKYSYYAVAKLSSVGAKVAYFITMNPASARVALTYVNKFKVRAATYISDRLAQSWLIEWIEASLKSWDEFGDRPTTFIDYFANTVDVLRDGFQTAASTGKRIDIRAVLDSVADESEMGLVAAVKALDEPVPANGKAAVATMENPKAISDTAGGPIIDWISSGLGDTVARTGLANRAIEAVASSNAITDLGGQAAALGGKMIGRMIGSIPVVGGVASLGIELMAEAAGRATAEVAAKAAKEAIYLDDVFASMTEVARMFNIDEVMGKMTFTRSYPHLQWRLVTMGVVTFLLRKHGVGIFINKMDASAVDVIQNALDEYSVVFKPDKMAEELLAIE